MDADLSVSIKEMATNFCQSNEDLELVSVQEHDLTMKYNGVEFSLTFSDMYSIDHYEIPLSDVLGWIKDLSTSKRFYTIREYVNDNIRGADLTTRKYRWEHEVEQLNGVPLAKLERLMYHSLIRIFITKDNVHIQGMFNYTFDMNEHYRYSRFRFNEDKLFTLLNDPETGLHYDSKRKDKRCFPLKKYKVIGWKMPKDTFVDEELMSEVFYFKAPKKLHIFQSKGHKKYLDRNYKGHLE